MMHLKRWLTSIVAIPPLVYMVSSGPRWILYGVLFLASVAGLLEFLRMTSPRFSPLVKVLSILLSFLFFYCLWRGPFFQALGLFSLWVMIPLVYFLFSAPDLRNHAAEDIGKLSLGFLYVILPLALLILIDRHPRGNLWILFLFTVIFFGDTGAFYFGRLFGRRKLYASVSPGKTWVGAFGGFFASVLSGLLFSYFFQLEGFPLKTGLLAGFLGVCGQVGDLVESMIKRSAGVKDSGRILPGHGGMLDRVDGLLFASPVLFLFIAWTAP
jgi:phosphatidate cytidylyltransferase